MPKKFKGENSKAVVAKARKAAVRAEEEDKKQRQLEDEFWKDDNKLLMKKQQRKDEKEKKRLEQLEKKKENDKLLEEEMSSLKSSKPPPSGKVTRAEVEANRERIAAEEAAARAQAGEPVVTDQPLEENINRLTIDGDEARNVEEAISVLSKGDPSVENHPEKRVKAAYTAYEDKNLPILKAENPNMRLSQLKQMLKKDWMKSPENPMNQRFANFNIKR